MMKTNDCGGRETFFSFAGREGLKVVSRQFLKGMGSKSWDKVKPSHVRIPLICSTSNVLLMSMLQPMSETGFNVLL